LIDGSSSSALTGGGADLFNKRSRQITENDQKTVAEGRSIFFGYHFNDVLDKILSVKTAMARNSF
jgi:hypothetical protein